MESGRRTLVKAIIWNATGLIVMALVGLIATGSIMVGGGMAVANTLIGLGTYVVYERVWGRIHWGLHVKSRP